VQRLALCDELITVPESTTAHALWHDGRARAVYFCVRDVLLQGQLGVWLAHHGGVELLAAAPERKQPTDGAHAPIVVAAGVKCTDCLLMQIEELVNVPWCEYAVITAPIFNDERRKVR